MLVHALPGHDQPSFEVHRLAIGKLPSQGVASTRSGRSWHLSPLNKTTTIEAAYLFRENVVILGWIGCCAGVTTIIDAASGKEKLEFLELNAHLTPRGLIVFERFYPHFSDPAIISEKIAVLDLNRPLPQNVPEKPFDNPTDQIGTTIYPLEAASGLRHEIGYNFVITDAGTRLFLADRRSTGNLCFVRISLLDENWRKTRENCVTSASFDAADLSSVHVNRFSENELGELILSVNIAGTKPPAARAFAIDKDSLAMTPVPPPNQTTAGSGALPIPWRVQRGAVMFFTPLLLKTETPNIVTVRLFIDEAGNVSDATVSGAPADLSELVKRAVVNWKFKPTILNGRHVKVITAFTASVSNLNKIPD